MKFIKNLLISIFCTMLILFFKLDDFLINLLHINEFSFYVKIGSIFIVYLVLFLLLCFLIDVFYIQIIVSLESKIETFLSKKILVKQKWKRLIIFEIRTTYVINKFFYKFRPGIVRYAYSKGNDIWICITKNTISEKIVSLLKFLFNPNFIVIILLVAKKSMFIDVNLKVIEEIINKFLTIKVDVKSIFSSMPLIVALLTLIPFVFFFYFYSDKAEVRKLVEESEQEKRKKEVIFLKLLLTEIWSAIYEISENLEYVTEHQELVVNLILNSKLSNFSKFNDRFSRDLITRTVDHYPFKDIEGLDRISHLINENKDKRMIFAWKYEIKELKNNFYQLENECISNKVFYTKKGMKLTIEENEKYKTNCYDEKCYAEQREYEKEIIANQLYNAYELLYKMYRFCIFVDSILYQSNNEKIVKKIFSKTK